MLFVCSSGLRPPMGSDPTLIERRYKANLSTVAAVCDRRLVGKTTLSHSMQGVSYFDCELRRVRRIIEEDPEGFLGQDLELLT